jgi:DNA recombination protein RmuC
MQATLSNGKRADCLIHLPKPPGPIVVDAKFPLEAYEAMRRAETPRAAEAARARCARGARHMRAIAERYIIEGETADGALMFLPSEAVYAELHANFPDVVREGFALKVWIVSPTTCMAVLNTMRAVLKDARMREQAGAIRKELALLHGDVDGWARGWKTLTATSAGGEGCRGDPHFSRKGRQARAAAGQLRLSRNWPHRQLTATLRRGA